MTVTGQVSRPPLGSSHCPLTYRTRRGHLLHLLGDSRLAVAAFQELGDLGPTDGYVLERVRHRGALLEWDLNPSAYWCTTDCRCNAWHSLDFRRVQQAITPHPRKVGTADVAY